MSFTCFSRLQSQSLVLRYEFHVLSSQFLYTLSSFSLVSSNDLLFLMFVQLTRSDDWQVALSGKYSRDYFNRHGDLRHIRRLRYWPLDNVLMEKYEYGEQDAKEFAEFLVPLLDFVPDKRPTAGQCLRHSWVASVPKEPEEVVACEAVSEGLRNIALAGGLSEATSNGINTKAASTKQQLVRNEGSHSKK